jgi:hypothetical protein
MLNMTPVTIYVQNLDKYLELPKTIGALKSFSQLPFTTGYL